MVINQSLRLKLVLLVGLLAVICLAAISWLNYQTAKQLLIKETEQKFLTAARAQAENINSWLVTRAAEMEIMADSSDVRSMDLTKQMPFLKKQLADLSQYYGNFYIADLSGQFHVTDGATGNIADRPYFKAALTGKTVISDPLISKTSGRTMITVAVPVKNDAGQVAGVLCGAVWTDTLNKMAADLQLGQSSYALILQRDGLTVVHPNKEFILKKNFLTEKSGGGLDEIVEKMTKGETGIGYYTQEGNEKLVGYSPVPATGWSFAVTIMKQEMLQSLTTLLSRSLTISVIVVLIAIAAVFIFSSLLVKPLQQLSATADQIANGDLTQTVTVKTGDEVGQLAESFNRMTANLRHLVNNINATAQQVVSSAEELSATAEESGKASEQVAGTISELAKGANDQAQATQQTLRLVESMTKSVDQVDNDATQVAEVMKTFQAVVERGLSTIDILTRRMEELRASAQQTTTSMKELEEHSRQISEIVEVITNIADQTNLLALNAAIEAARAGEQGRGFAVVAEEVRKLAEGSAQAANNIGKLIRDIQVRTTKTAAEAAGSEQIVNAQAEAVVETKNLFTEIAKGIENIDEQLRHVSQAVEQMSGTTREILTAIQNISSVTQQAAAGTEEVSAIAEEQTAAAQTITTSAQQLTRLAEELRKQVVKFQV
ncbi:MAG: methyl-accepting chemotaxis protein [Firmicutes bacterium]|nr:methyl-accepting chemotaxis protein [Bacillota bacterium]